MEIRRGKFWTTSSSLSFSRISPLPYEILHRILAKAYIIRGLIHTSAILLILLGLFFSSPPALGSDYEDQYRKARNHYYALKDSETKKKYRSYWLRCIEEFQAVYSKYPESPRADDALFTVAKLYFDLYSYSFLKSDLQKALTSFQSLVVKYPSSRLADDAQFKIGEIHLRRKEFSKAYQAFQKVVDQFPRGDMVTMARRKLIELKEYQPKPLAREVKDLSSVTEMRHWSNPDYTRVVIYMDGEASYRHHLLKQDPSIEKPPRLYIDIDSARISPQLKQPIPIHDGLLKMARAGQNSPDTVRVVLDIESIKDYNPFHWNDPFRIVIDIFGESSSEGKALAAIEEKRPVLPPPDPGIKRIVIDPGHGGHDPGAIGPSGLKEKDVVLRIAKRLSKELKKRGYEVFLTRERDIYLPLEERTAIANTKKADLFVSIHANASRKRGARGIETYILNFPSDEEAMELAARENAISPEKLTDLQIILYDLMLSAKLNDSSRLAHHVHRSICKSLKQRYSGSLDRRVKQAPFIVLMGARMPAILAEVSFISNRYEERKLKSRKYLDKIASSISDGLHGYAEETRAAYRPPPSQRKTSLKTRDGPERIIEGRMERGSCLYTALKKRGVSPDQIALITAHLKPIFDFRDCNPGDSFRVYLDDRGQLQRFTYKANLSYVYEVMRDGDRYIVSKKDLIFDRHLTKIKGEIESTLFDAIEEAGQGDRLAPSLHRYVRLGDRFSQWTHHSLLTGKGFG